MDANFSTMTMPKTMPVQNLLRYVSFKGSKLFWHFQRELLALPKTKLSQFLTISTRKMAITHYSKVGQLLVMSPSRNFPARAEPSYEGSEPSRAEPSWGTLIFELKPS